METLKVKDFNTIYPDSAFKKNRGFVTFDLKLKIAIWALTKAVSISDFTILENKLKLKAERNKNRMKKNAETKRLLDIAKRKSDYEAAITSEPVIVVKPLEDRFNVEYHVGEEKRIRNVSGELINSLLDTKQKKQFANGKQKKFTIDKYDFRAVIVNGARRPGVEVY